MGIGELRETLAGNLRLQGFGCRALGSPFYGDLLDRMAEDAEAGGIVWEVLGPHASASFGEVYPLRLLGGVHRLVLADDAPRSPVTTRPRAATATPRPRGGRSPRCWPTDTTRGSRRWRIHPKPTRSAARWPCWRDC